MASRAGRDAQNDEGEQLVNVYPSDGYWVHKAEYL